MVVGTEAQHTCALEGLGHKMAITRHPVLNVSLQTHYASPPKMSTRVHQAGPSVCMVPAPARPADAVHGSEVGGTAVSHPFAGCQPTLHALPMPSKGLRKEGRRCLPGSIVSDYSARCVDAVPWSEVGGSSLPLQTATC